MLDVVVLKDPSKPATKGNIAKVFDFKFNCKSKGTMLDKQRRKYKKATGCEPEMLHAW